MLGMVPVQVIGSPHMNEPWYASPDHPGLAIGRHQLDVARLKEASFAGYSFSVRQIYDETSVSSIVFQTKCYSKIVSTIYLFQTLFPKVIFCHFLVY